MCTAHTSHLDSVCQFYNYCLAESSLIVLEIPQKAYYGRLEKSEVTLTSIPVPLWLHNAAALSIIIIARVSTSAFHFTQHAR